MTDAWKNVPPSAKASARSFRTRPSRAVGPLEVDIDRLSPNAFQPRAACDDARLDELAQSIKSNGVIQPIVVRKVGDRFQIIAGERRWRAAQKAGLLRVPVVVRDVAPGEERSLLEMALIENIQRENLNPIDEALRLSPAERRISASRRKTSPAAVGKDRASVANFLRLLKLPDEVRAEVAAGTLSMGHARALVALPSEADQRRVARDVIATAAVGARDRVAGQEDRARAAAARSAGDACAEASRRSYARGRGPAAARSWHPCPHRPAGRARPDRDRFRFRRRADPDLRAADDGQQ